MDAGNTHTSRGVKRVLESHSEDSSCGTTSRPALRPPPRDLGGDGGVDRRGLVREPREERREAHASMLARVRKRNEQAAKHRARVLAERQESSVLAQTAPLHAHPLSKGLSD